jgi:hypothetical protein
MIALVDIPDIKLGRRRRIEFSLTFGMYEIEAMAIRKNSGLSSSKVNERKLPRYTTTLELDI